MISTPGRKSCLQSQAGISVWQVLTVVALLTVDLGPQKVHGGTGFFNGTILDEFIDVPRRLERRYPYNNMTSSSLNQYREDVRNGNDYNLVGDNVGDATTFNDSYVRRFVTTSTSLDVGRSDLVAVSVAGKILFAGGVTGDLMGQQSRRVDVFDAR